MMLPPPSGSGVYTRSRRATPKRGPLPVAVEGTNSFARLIEALLKPCAFYDGRRVAVHREPAGGEDDTATVSPSAFYARLRGGTPPEKPGLHSLPPETRLHSPVPAHYTGIDFERINSAGKLWCSFCRNLQVTTIQSPFLYESSPAMSRWGFCRPLLPLHFPRRPDCCYELRN